MPNTTGRVLRERRRKSNVCLVMLVVVTLFLGMISQRRTKKTERILHFAISHFLDKILVYSCPLLFLVSSASYTII